MLKQKVEIFMWRPINNSYGHTALRTDRDISFWPKGGYKLKLKQKRPADHEIQLRTLYLYLAPGDLLEYAGINEHEQLERIQFTLDETNHELVRQALIANQEHLDPILENAVFKISSRRGYNPAHFHTHSSDRRAECAVETISAREATLNHLSNVFDFQIEPDTCPGGQITSIGAGMAPEELEDIIDEKIPDIANSINAEPSAHITLCSLNVAAINEEFEKIPPHISFGIPEGAPIFNKPYHYYCSSFALHLLRIGGLDNLLTSSSKASDGRWYGSMLSGMLGALLLLMLRSYNKLATFSVSVALILLGRAIGGFLGSLFEASADIDELKETYGPVLEQYRGQMNAALEQLRETNNTENDVSTELQEIFTLVELAKSNSTWGLFKNLIKRKPFQLMLYGHGDHIIKKLIAAPIHVAKLAEIAHQYEEKNYQYNYDLGECFTDEDLRELMKFEETLQTSAKTSAASRLEPSFCLPLIYLFKLLRYPIIQLETYFSNFLVPKKETLRAPFPIAIPDRTILPISEIVTNPIAVSLSVDRATTSSGTWKCAVSKNDQLICVEPNRNISRTVNKFSGKPWSEIPEDHYEQCEVITQDGLAIRHCTGNETEFVEYDSKLNNGPTLVSILGSAAFSGAVYAALPEAIGDTLHLSGIVSEKNAKYIKIATNSIMILATGSWLATGASWLTNAALRQIGCSESKARIAGNTAAFLVNTGRNITPTGITATIVNYAAGRIGLWAEKRIAQQFSPPKGNPNSPCAATI